MSWSPTNPAEPYAGCSHESEVTDAEVGEIMCGSCGVILAERMSDRGRPDRLLSGEDGASKSQFGPTTKLALDDMGLSTMISSRDVDASGKRLPGRARTNFSRLRLWDRNSKSKLAVLREPMVLLDGMRSKLFLSRIVIEDSAYIYRKAVAAGLIRGRRRHVMMSASIYAACRINGTPRTVHDIACASNVTKKSLQRSYRILVQHLDLRPELFEATDFITRLATSVGVHEKTRRDAVDLLRNAQEIGAGIGRNPVGLASAALYLAGVKNRESVSQKGIAHKSGSTSVTIRNGVRHLKKMMGHVL